MTFWFWVSLVGLVLIQPILYASYEHQKLRERYGSERGNKIGRILGTVSGYVFFALWAGLWMAPQPRFEIPLLREIIFVLPVLFTYVSLKIPIIHLILGIAFLIPGAWLGLKGMTTLSLEVSAQHLPREVIKSDIYSRVRHPQYLGGFLSHIGISLLLSASLSLICTPIVLIVIYFLCRKEERELIREFGDEYREYKQEVPMFVPRLRDKKKRSPV
ncbi:isoprenylcysteine carboxylmethyltransferase family protein [Candidatus Thorarchaeota archaeon]|nr:MAG: isoprenylcysteine carboxylmethyltransferase family protein [Candidatus Thorarchaeota archaeon]